MKGFILASCLVFAFIHPTHAQAQKKPSLELSPTFSIVMPDSLAENLAFLPSFHGFRFEGKVENRSCAVWITRRRPDTLANTFSVSEFWKENLDFTRAIGETVVDLGCKKIQKYAYRCDRTAARKQDDFAAEALFWNSKSDLVVIRAMSNESIESAQRCLSESRVTIVDRLPAGGSQ